jgi:hypothetical protein
MGKEVFRLTLKSRTGKSPVFSLRDRRYLSTLFVVLSFFSSWDNGSSYHWFFPTK